MPLATRIRKEKLYFVFEKDKVRQQTLTLDIQRTQTGEKVTGWRSRIQEGVQAGSEYHAVQTRVKRRFSEGVTLKTRQVFVPGVVTATVYSGEPGYNTVKPSPFADTVEVENVALMKVIRKVRQESAHMNGWSFTGELRETIQQLRHPFQSMRNQVYGHLNKLSKRKLAMNRLPPVKREQAWRKAIADTWLETSFGLIPLVHDTKDIAESIARFATDEPRKVRVNGKAGQSRSEVEYAFNVPLPGGALFSADRWMRTDWEIGCKYAVGLEGTTVANYGAVDRLRQVLGFNLENFVPGLYEVMPWSWLVDYFSNLGDIIEAGTTDESRVKWIVKSVRRSALQKEGYSVNMVRTMLNLSPPQSTLFVDIDNRGVLSSLELEQQTLDRTLPKSLGTPVFRVEHPFDKIKKMANLLAVLTQFSGKAFDPRWPKKYRESMTVGQHGRGTFGRNSADFQV